MSLSWNEMRIVMDVPRENLKTILKQAQQVEMITEKNHYIITSLDLHTIDLEDFQYSKCNITGLRLVNEESVEYEALLTEINARSYRKKKRRMKTITSASAMIFDAVQLFAKALDELDVGKKIDSFPSLQCDDSNIKGTDGTTILNYMKSSKVHGLTGVVHFDGQGFRSSFTLDIMQLSNTGLRRIGSVMPGGVVNITEFVSMEEFNDFSPKRRKFVITTIKNEPFTMLKISRQKLTGNDRFEGFSIDLIEALSKELDFDYEIRIVADERYGAEVDKEKKIWNGMIGEVLRGDADMAVADVTMSTARESVVDFTMPFMSTGIGLLIKKPTEKVKSLFSFLSPFSMEVWIYVMAVVLGVSSVLCFVGRLSPYEWENKTPCNQDDTSLDNEFTMLNSMWFTFGSLMQQGCEVAPRSSSTRTIASFWYFFTLIMISSYTANLAAFLTIEKVVYPIENVRDLAKQTKVKYGCVGTGSTKSFFETSTIPTYKKMWEFMKANPDVFMQSNEQGKERVIQGNYVFLMESASIEFTIERVCNLTQVGGLLDSKGYGIASRKGNDSLAAWLTPAILKLQEHGVLHSLKDKWWKQKRGGGLCQENTGQSGSVRELGLSNVGGVFVVLLMGIVMAATVAILEFLWKFRKFQTSPRETVGRLLMEEIKLALTCGSSVKKLQNRKKVPSY